MCTCCQQHNKSKTKPGSPTHTKPTIKAFHPQEEKDPGKSKKIESQKKSKK